MAKQFLQVDLAIDVPQGPSKCFDDDGRLKRTGNVWTASAHIITAVIGSGVLSLGWAIAQLGWVAGPAVMFLFAFVIYYTSTLLSDCYRSGGAQVKICGWIQYLNIFGVAIGYTIAASISMMAIKRSNCFHSSGGKNPCQISSNLYMIMFGASEIVLSQIPDFDQLWWLSIVAAVMSFTYSSVGLALGIGKVVGKSSSFLSEFHSSNYLWFFMGPEFRLELIFLLSTTEHKGFGGSLTGISIGNDTVKSPPSEAKTMRKATLISVAVTTTFYMLCGCMGYAAFGDNAPSNLLTGFGFYNPYWLLDIANAAIVIHLVGAYQVYCQPLFAFIEKWAQQRWPKNTFISKEFQIQIPCTFKTYNLNLFRLVWRTIFVIVTTIFSMLLPFFNDVVGILGAFGFWPLTVYYPVEMYISQKKIAKWSSKWVCLQILSMACLIISIAAAVGSVAGVVLDLKVDIPSNQCQKTAMSNH
ncbi:Amino acid permease 2 [Nymphaea thermarum]|nr:Amino acid permease 2 [Nymphaea thermarum]